MPLKYIYKMNGMFVNKSKPLKNIENFADEFTGYCEEKWGDNYLDKNEQERIDHCNSKCSNNLDGNYNNKMKSDGREFEDCNPIDGNNCAFNFSITNAELKDMEEDSLEEPENYESPDRVEDCNIKTEIEERKKKEKTNEEGEKVINEMAKISEKGTLDTMIKNDSAIKEINERKKAVGHSIQGGVDKIFANAFSGDWRREKFTNLSYEKNSNIVIIFIFTVILVKLFEIVYKYCYSKQII